MYPSWQVNFKRAGQFIQYIGSLEETIFQKRARIHQVALMSLSVCSAGSRVNLAGSLSCIGMLDWHVLSSVCSFFSWTLVFTLLC